MSVCACLYTILVCVLCVFAFVYLCDWMYQCKFQSESIYRAALFNLDPPTWAEILSNLISMRLLVKETNIYLLLKKLRSDILKALEI